MPRRKKVVKKARPTKVTKPQPEVERQHLMEAVDQVERWILSGARDLQITASAAATFPGFDPTVLYNAAALKIAQNANHTDEMIFGFCIAATFDIYHQLRTNGDLAGALTAIKQVAALQKSKPPPPPPEEEPTPC